MGRGRRLQKISDVRRYLGHLIHMLENDEIDENRAGKLGYIASLLIRAIEKSDHEKRIEDPFPSRTYP